MKKIGFFRRALLKLITQLEKLSYLNKLYLFSVFLNRLHFFIYTGTTFPKAIEENKRIVIGAFRRRRNLIKIAISRLPYHKETKKTLLGLVYVLYMKECKKSFLTLAYTRLLGIRQ